MTDAKTDVWPKTDVWMVARSATLRRGLRSLLEEAGSAHTVGESSDLEWPLAATLEVLIFAGPLEPSWTRSEIGLELPPRLYLLEPGDALPALESGVGLLHFDADALELSAALSAVREGLCVLSPALLERFSGDSVSAPSPNRSALEYELTPREREVLELLSAGLPNKSIAKRLSISEHTVKFHLGQIFAKLEVSSRSEAVGLAVRSGLVSL